MAPLRPLSAAVRLSQQRSCARRSIYTVLQRHRPLHGLQSTAASQDRWANPPSCHAIGTGIQLPSTRSLSTHSLSDQIAPRSRPPWMDGNQSLQGRVSSLIEARKLQPYDLQSKIVQSLVSACCRLNTLAGLQWAEDIVERLILEKKRLAEEEGGELVPVPSHLWSQLVYGWAVIADQRPVAMTRMRDVIQRCMEEADYDTAVQLELVSRNAGDAPQRLGSWPTVDIFNTYLFGLVQASKQSRSAALRSEEVLTMMQTLYHDKGWHCRPNTRSYTHVLKAYANSRHPSAGQCALRVLREMQKVHEEEKMAYEQQFGVEYDEIDDSANRRKIVTADVVACTAAMQANINSRRDAAKAIELLAEILNDATLRVDSAVFLMAIKAFGRLTERGRSAEKRIAFARQAEEVLRMRIDYGKSGHLDDPEGLLQAYNACLDVWSKSYSEDAALECERLLQAMIKEEDGAVKPNTVSFNSCLYAWSRANTFHPDAPFKAEELLEFQHEVCDSGVLPAAAGPDLQSYALVILAHASSSHKDKVNEARRLLETLLDRIRRGSIKMDRNKSAPFSAVLAAIAKTSPNQSQTTEDLFSGAERTNDDFFGMAQQTFQQVVEDKYQIGAEPDHHLYSAYLRCIATHCDERSSQRETESRAVFEAACEAGHVSQMVVDAWVECQGEQALEGLESLPRFWFRNVPASYRYQPKRSRGGKPKKSGGGKKNPKGEAQTVW